MPKRKRYTKKSRKGRRPRYRRRRRRRRKTVRLLRSPVPLRTVAKLRYCDALNLAAPGALGTFTTVSYRANGMFDPYVPTGGHQPMGFDQIMEMYQHYTVIGAHITVTPLKRSDAACGLLSLSLSDSNSFTFASLTDALETRRNVTSIKLLPYDTDAIKRKVSLGFGGKKFFGPGYQAGGADYKGTNATDPIEQAYFKIHWGPLSPSTLTGNIDLMVKIDYIALFTAPIPLQGS